jgi:arabinose-5-phosphate isomerase
MGKSGHIARKIAATLSSTGTIAHFIHPAEAGHGDLGMIAKDDIVILLSNSGETDELNSIINYCKRFSIKIIGITRNSSSTLAEVSDVVLVLPKTPEASEINAPTTSSTMMLVLGDALAIALHNTLGFSKEDYQILHPGGSIGTSLSKVVALMHTKEEIPLVQEYAEVYEVILEITAKRQGCTGVLNAEGEMVGIITNGDLSRHLSAGIAEPLKAKARNIMGTHPITISSKITAAEALAIMNNNSITNLFVVEDKKPIGVLHIHDLLKCKMM